MPQQPTPRIDVTPGRGRPAHGTARPGARTGNPSARRSVRTATRAAAQAVVLVALGASLAGCDGGPSGPTGTGRTSGAATGAAGDPTCPVGQWTVPAQEEFAQVGLGALTDSSVQATAGTIGVVFEADHTYTFTYDKVRLSLADGSGSATVDGPVHGTWQLAGDALTTTVRTSRIAVAVSVAGVTGSPSQSLNTALQRGLPGSARVRCAEGRLVTTITAGVAKGRQVTFGRA